MPKTPVRLLGFPPRLPMNCVMRACTSDDNPPLPTVLKFYAAMPMLFQSRRTCKVYMTSNCAGRDIGATPHGPKSPSQRSATSTYTSSCGMAVSLSLASCGNCQCSHSTINHHECLQKRGGHRDRADDLRGSAMEDNLFFSPSGSMTQNSRTHETQKEGS